INAQAKLPLLLMGYQVPGVKTATTAYEPYALELIAGILDAGDGARFSKNLIRGSHIASGADVYYNMYSRYATQFIIYGSPTQQHPLKDLETALITELNELKKTPVTATELQRVKNQIIAQKTFEKDSIFAQAMELGLLETIGLGWQKADEYSQTINSITPEQIQLTAQRYFRENNMTIAELKPALQQEVAP
ncbi:MAG: M16 family metallopeptidase, partial [Legionella sp.]